MAISVLVMCSIFIALNGNALTGPRAYFAMARDGLFPATLCRIHPRFQTPAHAVDRAGGWAILLTVAGTTLILIPPPEAGGRLPGPIRLAWTKLHQTPLYDVLYTYVIFGATLFTMLAIASVFVLRARRPDLPRPYRTWGYPATPLLYIVRLARAPGEHAPRDSRRVDRRPADHPAGTARLWRLRPQEAPAASNPS